MRYLYQIVLSFLIAFVSYGQMQNTIWRFGNLAGLNFSGGSPFALGPSSMNSVEGSASVSDNQGKLLFYTDGRTVWDKNDNPMPNGTGLIGGTSSTHVKIVQKPNDCSKYYIFHVGDHVSANKEFGYTIVDMCLNGGLGDVVTSSKNVVLNQPGTEKIAVTPHANGKDIWIVNLEYGSNKFYAYLLTAAGLNPAVQSTLGSVHPAFSTSGVGSCKFNHAGTKLVVIGTNNGIFEKFDFNKTTGVLSNAVNLHGQYTVPWGLYGAEFSPNDKYLYVTSLTGPNQLLQLQMFPAIQNVISSFSIIATDVYGALQLAPDGKIYMAQNGYNVLGRINNPDNPSLSCNFVGNAISIFPNASTLGLPCYIPNSTVQPTSNFVSLGNDTTIPCSSSINLNLSAGTNICNTTYTWNTGANTSSITALQSGTFIVTASNICGRDSDTIVIKQPPINISVNVVPSATICSSKSVTLNCSGVTSCTWQPGNIIGTSVTVSPLSSQSYTAFGATGSCTASAVQFIKVDPTPLVTINPSTVNICSGQSATLTALGAANYTWMPGNTTGNTLVVSPATTSYYSVTGENAFGCTNVSTVVVNVGNLGSIQVSSPSNGICIGETITLTASGASSYTWNPGNIVSNTIAVSPSVTQSYTVVSSVGFCSLIAVETITVIPSPTLSINASAYMICGGSSVTLNASGGLTYTWQPGNTVGNSITVSPNTNQIYTVNCGVGTCTSSAVKEVTVVTSVNLSLSGSSYTVCKGQPLVLSASGAEFYNWTPGNFPGNDSITIYPVQSATYNVGGTIGFCSDNASLTVFVPSINADFTDNSTNITWLEQVDFYNMSINNAYNFWYFSDGQSIQTSNETNTSILFDDPGKYIACLMVTNDFGCSDTLCKAIEVGCPEDAVYVPNTFTPNDDGLNDVFRAVTVAQCLDKFSISIFDRWGEKLFETNDILKAWDGSYKNKPVKEDVYVYKLEYQMVNGKSFSKTGHILLMK